MRTKKVETYSIVILRDGSTDFEIKENLSAEETKAALANTSPLDASFVFVGPQVLWASEIVLHAAASPTQKPVEKRKYTPRKAKVEGVIAAGAANGKTEAVT